MADIRKAIQTMLETGEFEKVIKHAKGREKDNAKAFYDAVRDLGGEELAKVPEIVLITACRSWNVWQDLYCHMRMPEDEKQDAEKA